MLTCDVCGYNFPISIGDELDACDLCLVVGTSSVVYPAAMFAPQVAARGVPVAEFNVETTPATNSFGLVIVSPFSFSKLIMYSAHYLVSYNLYIFPQYIWILFHAKLLFLEEDSVCQGKVYGRVVTKRSMEVSVGNVSEEQGRFRRGTGCVNQIFVIKIMVEVYFEKKVGDKCLEK